MDIWPELVYKITAVILSYYYIIVRGHILLRIPHFGYFCDESILDVYYYRVFIRQYLFAHHWFLEMLEVLNIHHLAFRHEISLKNFEEMRILYLHLF